MEWLNEATTTIMEYLNKNYPFLILKGMVFHTTTINAPKLTIPIALMAVALMLPLSSFIEEWWYAPSWMVVLMTVIYVVDLATAIILTGRLKNKAWEFRSDKFAIWVANFIGALLVVGLLHFIPLAMKQILSSVHIDVNNISAVYYTLLATAWGTYVGICASNVISGISNAARAGILTKKVADYVIKRFDTYKPSVFGDKFD